MEKKVQQQEEEIAQLERNQAENAKKQKKHSKHSKKLLDKEEESKSPQLLQNEEVPHKVKKIKFVRTENSNSKEEHKGISKGITNSVAKSNKSKESWDEQIAKSDQKMDQATGLISVSESEEEKHEELATANVVENRKKDVKKAK